MSALQDPYFFYTGIAGLLLLGVLALAVIIRDARTAAGARGTAHLTVRRPRGTAVGRWPRRRARRSHAPRENRRQLRGGRW